MTIVLDNEILEEVITKLGNYLAAIEQIDAAMNSIHDLVAGNEGKAVDKLLSDYEVLKKAIEVQKEEVADLYDIFYDYKEEMTMAIGGVYGDVSRVARYDIEKNSNQIVSAIRTLIYEMNKGLGKDNFQFDFRDDQEEKENQEENYRLIHEIQDDLFPGFKSLLHESIEKVEQINTNYVVPYVETDSMYRAKADELYEKYTPQPKHGFLSSVLSVLPITEYVVDTKSAVRSFSTGKMAEGALSLAAMAPFGDVIKGGSNVKNGAGKVDAPDGKDVSKDSVDGVPGGSSAKQTVKSNLGKEIDITPSGSHSTTTTNPGYEGTPNSSVDILDASGEVKTRRYYGPDGKAMRDVDMTNHGNPKQHPEFPHEHFWTYNPDGTPKGR